MYFDVKKPETTNKTFRLPNPLLGRLEELAQQKGVSLNYLVVQCCEFSLAHLRENMEKEEVG